MITTIDGKIHHLKELAFIEKMLFEDVLDPDTYYKELADFLSKQFDLKTKDHFTTKELLRIDQFTHDYFGPRIEEFKVWLLRLYVMGRFLAETDIKGQMFNIGDFNKLPKFIQDAIKKYNLTLEEAKALERAVESGASELSNTSISTIQTVRNVLVDSTQQHGTAGTVLQKLRETLSNKDTGELNRDWAKVAITETNRMFSDGYLSLMNDGEFVVGFTMPDACDICVDLIRGKVYRVRKDIPEDYTDLPTNSKKYLELAEIWEKYVWVGKTNYGRSASKQKRINPLEGNRKSNLRDKHHHEFSMPVIPMHPSCRCRWVRIDIEFQWIDSDGRIRLRAEDPVKHKEWYEDLLNEYGIKKSNRNEKSLKIKLFPKRETVFN